MFADCHPCTSYLPMLMDSLTTHEHTNEIVLVFYLQATNIITIAMDDIKKDRQSHIRIFLVS